MPESCREGRTCTLCCKLFAISTPGFEKPVNAWCRFAKPSAGCTCYESRPEQCQSYACLWLQSQEKPVGLPPELKPSRCHVIFDSNLDGTMVVARVDPAYPGAERAAPVQSFIRKLWQNQILTYVVCADRRYIYGNADPALLKRIEESIIEVKEPV